MLAGNIAAGAARSCGDRWAKDTAALELRISTGYE